MNFHAAVEAHLAWTVRFRQAIRNRALPPVVHVGRDDCCPLGEWLHEVARHHYAHLPSFEPCLVRHAAFHREAARVLEAAHRHGAAHAEALLAPDSAYTTASGMLMVSLADLQREAFGPRPGARPPGRLGAA